MKEEEQKAKGREEKKDEAEREREIVIQKERDRERRVEGICQNSVNMYMHREHWFQRSGANERHGEDFPEASSSHLGLEVRVSRAHQAPGLQEGQPSGNYTTQPYTHIHGHTRAHRHTHIE